MRSEDSKPSKPSSRSKEDDENSSNRPSDTNQREKPSEDMKPRNKEDDENFSKRPKEKPTKDKSGSSNDNSIDFNLPQDSFSSSQTKKPFNMDEGKSSRPENEIENSSRKPIDFNLPQDEKGNDKRPGSMNDEKSSRPENDMEEVSRKPLDFNLPQSLDSSEFDPTRVDNERENEFSPSKRPFPRTNDDGDEGSQVKRKKKPRRRSKTRQWTPSLTSTDSCEENLEDSWKNFADENPSKLCTVDAARELCICNRNGPTSIATRLCGSCKTSFLPATVDGVSLKNLTKTKPPRDRTNDKLVKPTKSSSFKWKEVSSDATCDTLEDETLRDGSPSILCNEDGGREQRRCLCVLKDGIVKNVCGKCSLTFKIGKK